MAAGPNPGAGANAGFTATPADIQAAAQAAQSTAAEVQDDLNALRAYVQDIYDTMWQGRASDTFQALMIDFDIYAKMLHQALEDISSGLQTNHFNYMDTEEQLKGQLQAVNGLIPGANFS